MEEEEGMRPAAGAGLLVPPVLDRLGVEELRLYVAALHAEIARVEAEIGRKQGLRAAADSFFKL